MSGSETVKKLTIKDLARLDADISAAYEGWAAEHPEAVQFPAESPNPCEIWAVERPEAVQLPKAEAREDFEAWSVEHKGLIEAWAQRVESIKPIHQISMADIANALGGHEAFGDDWDAVSEYCQQ